MTLRFASRDDAFAGYPWLAHHVHAWQSQALDPSADRYEPGDEVFMELDDEDATVLSVELADRLNRQHDADLDALRDRFNDTLPEAQGAAATIAEPPGATMEQSAAQAGAAFSDLCNELGCDEIAILPMTRTPILVQDNEHSDSARRQLEELSLKPEFDGAIIGAPDEIAPFVGPLFWIARCNACAPYIAFGMKGLAIAGAFCQYVNFHFDSYDEDASKALPNALDACGFAVPMDGLCRERFSETGAIEGRRLDLGIGTRP